MIQAGTKFSSKPRNGYDYIYEIVEVDGGFTFVRNTSFPEYDTRGEIRLQSTRDIEMAFEVGDFIVLN